MNNFSEAERFITNLDHAKSYSEIWQVVQETAAYAVGKRRNSMMLFLDDLPLQYGAYYSVGTNNIVLNRTLVDTVEASCSDRATVNALIYNLLLHEYLHALGELSEATVRQTTFEVAKKSFGENHIATILACKSPWILLNNLTQKTIISSKRVMEIVHNFEKTDKYIV